jgi:hypothetical protein
MDPDMTLKELLEAMEQEDWDQVDQLSAALLHWLAREGFPPRTLGSRALGDEWHLSLTRHVCLLANMKVHSARKSKVPPSGL